jgi:hypothetical protein
MLSLNNKIFKKIESRNRLKNSSSFKRPYNSINKLNTFYSITNNTRNINSYENYKSTNFNSISNTTKRSNNKVNFHKLKIYDEEKFKLPITNRIMRFSKGLFQKIKRKKNKLELDSEESDKLCILPDYFNVKNFTLKTSKVVDYLNLNENNNFFLFKKNIRKLKNKFDFPENYKTLRQRSYTPINRNKKIEEIYPTVFNIEGKKNRKLLEEIENEKRRKTRKIEFLNNKIKKNNNILKKKMIRERNKAEEENNKINLSNMAYRRQLLLSRVKFIKKDLNHLKRKNSFKFHLELPLYNFFLNLNY